jgi:hypothetical protein
MSSGRDTNRDSAGEGSRAASPEAARPRVVVVGAGVSGCACAAALATSGLHVTLMNSAMDRVGLPAYGPDLVGDSGGWSRIREALEGLPSPLGQVWLGAASAPASGREILNIDRRRVSIETKRALERIPGLDFRQGFVTDLRIVHSDPREPPGPGDDEREREAAAGRQRLDAVQVETIFGEVFEADAAVVAAGLSLDASTVVGAAEVKSGRYGEPSSDGLWAALRALGEGFHETTAEVGPRVSVRDAIAAGWLPDGACEGAGVQFGEDASGLTAQRLLPVTGQGEPQSWPADFPPAPHWDRSLQIDWMVTGPGTGKDEGADRVGPVLSPDGVATAELYVAPGNPLVTRLEVDAAEGSGLVATRMSQAVAGKALTGLSESGRMQHKGHPGPVWVVGRAAGALGYAASLISGVRAAADIAESLGIRVSSGVPGAGPQGHGLAVQSPSSVEISRGGV